MDGRSPELNIDIPEKTDGGFSEKRIARVLEGKQADNSQVKKRKPLVSGLKQKVLQQIARRDSSQQPQQAANAVGSQAVVAAKENILAAFEENAKQLGDIVQELGRMQDVATRRYEQLMQEAQVKQKLQGELLSLLAHQQKGDISEEDLSKQLANLVK